MTNSHKGLHILFFEAGEIDWEELLPAQVSPGGLQVLCTGVRLSFAQSDLQRQHAQPPHGGALLRLQSAPLRRPQYPFPTATTEAYFHQCRSKCCIALVYLFVVMTFENLSHLFMIKIMIHSNYSVLIYHYLIGQFSTVFPLTQHSAPDVHSKGGLKMTKRGGGGGFGYQKGKPAHKAKIFKHVNKGKGDKRQFSRWPAILGGPLQNGFLTWTHTLPSRSLLSRDLSMTL